MSLPRINLNKDQISDFEGAIQKEWIVTNDFGGYASSTVLGINTRKYHGLLVASLPQEGRRVYLSELNEEVEVGNKTYSLGSSEFQNGISPKGYLLLKEFSVTPYPKYRYSIEEIQVEKTIFLPQEKNGVIVLYEIRNKSDQKGKIRIFPLINGRPFHMVTDRRNTNIRFTQIPENRGVEVYFEDSNSILDFRTTQGRYMPQEKWIENIYFREEANRGESHLDDCYQPGYFQAKLKSKDNRTFAITTLAVKKEEHFTRIQAETWDTMQELQTLMDNEIRRRQNLLTDFYKVHKRITEKSWLNWIILATDMFIVRGATFEQKNVIAGYHWFKTWGRDTFISLPGLMLVTGRFPEARKVFLTYRDRCKHGLIPNFISDREGNVAYNSVDATLWYINSVFQYLKYTADLNFVKEKLWKTLKSTIEDYERGTTFNIHVGSDGLLHHGPQLTWMDAAIHDQPVTPRGGMAVEVQALWYNALKIMQTLANKFKEKNKAERYSLLAEKARKSFIDKFWNKERNSLFDCVSEQDRDDQLRPNQIIAVSLDFNVLDNKKNKKIVDVVHRQLLTPYGLRSLAKKDPRYKNGYTGDRWSRNQAYHNGTVWPWLLGPFTTAFLKTEGNTQQNREYALKNFLTPLLTQQIFESGLGNLNEIYDGDPPHRPRGCIAQAWSVAEPLRAYIEDVLQVRPRKEKEYLSGLELEI